MSDAGRRASESVAPVGSTFRARLLKVPGMGVGAAGRRSPARTAAGRLVADRVPTGRPKGIHVVSTLLAAAPHQLARGREPGSDLELRAADLREPVREGRESNLIVFVVDASGSMAARARMSAVKGATAALLLDAYQRRDKVAVITFRGVAAEVVLTPTSSVEVAARSLQVLAAGGRTPIAAGLLRARTLLQGERLRDPLRRPLLVLITDGRATGGSDSRSRARAAAAALSSDGVAAVVVDCESGPVRLGLARELARDLRAPLFGPQELSAVGLAAAVREQWEVA